jgi:hypothetical protein
MAISWMKRFPIAPQKEIVPITDFCSKSTHFGEPRPGATRQVRKIAQEIDESKGDEIAQRESQESPKYERPAT